jgi:endonuclease YncB( thermonuclease family)
LGEGAHLDRRAILLGLAALPLAGCGDGGLGQLAAAGKGRVIEVRSGDLVVLDSGQQLRLAGLQAPYGGMPGAGAARAALDGLALGQEVELLSGGALADPTGRKVAHLRRLKGRLWLQGAMLDAGMAQVRTFADNRAMAGVMLEREARARIARRGLWADGKLKVLVPQEVAADQRGFAVVEGRVGRVRRIGEGFDLDLLEASRTVSGEVPAKVVADFATGGKRPTELAGKLIRIRGTLRPGGQIWLDHPEAVEIVSQG